MQPDTKMFARFTIPNAGYESERELASHLLKLDEKYEVELVNMGQSSTSIKLKWFSVPFNSVHFEFSNEDGTPTDIFDRGDTNPYLRMMGINSPFKGQLPLKEE